MKVRSSQFLQRQQGFSLVELMVGMVLGLLLLGAIMQVYLSTKLTFNTQDEKSALEESGRYALDVLARDVRIAGLAGCNSRFMPGAQRLPVRNHLNGGTAYPFEFTTAVRGFEAQGSGPGQQITLAATNPAPGGTWDAALPAEVAALAVPGSDVLLLSGLTAQTWPLVDPFTQGAQIFVQSGNDIVQGDVLFVTDCAQGIVFQASSVNTAGGKTNVTGAKSGAISPGNTDPISDQGPNGGAFRQGAMVARAVSFAYFIGRGANGAPALFRASLLRTDASPSARALRTEELISDIESMQLLYGVDSDGDFAINEFRTAAAVGTAWNDVRTVRAAFLARASSNTLTSEDTATYSMLGTRIDPVNDRRQRRVFEVTISLRNRLP
jgi:type IV pilus assembly protein PilW